MMDNVHYFKKKQKHILLDMLFSDLPVGGNNDLGKVAVVKQVSPVFVFLSVFVSDCRNKTPLLPMRSSWWMMAAKTKPQR